MIYDLRFMIAGGSASGAENLPELLVPRRDKPLSGQQAGEFGKFQQADSEFHSAFF